MRSTAFWKKNNRPSGYITDKWNTSESSSEWGSPETCVKFLAVEQRQRHGHDQEPNRFWQRAPALWRKPTFAPSKVRELMLLLEPGYRNEGAVVDAQELPSHVVFELSAVFHAFLMVAQRRIRSALLKKFCMSWIKTFLLTYLTLRTIRRL